jgi:hypothetical protein
MAAPRQCTNFVRGAAVLLLLATACAAADPGDDLRAAARKGQTKEVASLISRGTPLDAADRDGHTALMLAAQRGHAETVKLLLDRGAKPDLRDKQGLSAYALALLAGRDDVLRVFPHHDPIRVELQVLTATENVYSSCAITPRQLSEQIASLQLDAVVAAALREYAALSGKGAIQFVDSGAEMRLALKVRPAVSCVQQQVADNVSLAIDAKAVRATDGTALLEKTFGGGLKGLHAKSATSPAQYPALFADWAKAHAPQIYWAAVEAWLRAR